MRTWRRTLGSAVFAAAVAVASACTFPDVNLNPVDAALADGSKGPEAGGDRYVPGADSSGDVGPPPSPDASVDSPIIVDPDAQVDATDPCDQDGDGDRAEGACGGGDCDDHDYRANSSVTMYLTYDPTADPVSHVTPLGDWNCNGVVQPKFTPGFACSGILLPGNCPSQVGFMDTPACGQPGTLLTCKLMPVTNLCITDQTTPGVIQGCM